MKKLVCVFLLLAAVISWAPIPRATPITATVVLAGEPGPGGEYVEDPWEFIFWWIVLRMAYAGLAYGANGGGDYNSTGSA